MRQVSELGGGEEELEHDPRAHPYSFMNEIYLFLSNRMVPSLAHSNGLGKRMIHFGQEIRLISEERRGHRSTTMNLNQMRWENGSVCVCFEWMLSEAELVLVLNLRFTTPRYYLGCW